MSTWLGVQICGLSDWPPNMRPEADPAIAFFLETDLGSSKAGPPTLAVAGGTA